MRVSGEEATRVVLTVLAAKTGYEPDMIEMDMALETEVRTNDAEMLLVLIIRSVLLHSWASTLSSAWRSLVTCRRS